MLPNLSESSHGHLGALLETLRERVLSDLIFYQGACYMRLDICSRSMCESGVFHMRRTAHLTCAAQFFIEQQQSNAQKPAEKSAGFLFFGSTILERETGLIG